MVALSLAVEDDLGQVVVGKSQCDYVPLDVSSACCLNFIFYLCKNGICGIEDHSVCDLSGRGVELEFVGAFRNAFGYREVSNQANILCSGDDREHLIFKVVVGISCHSYNSVGERAVSVDRLYLAAVLVLHI